MTGAAAGGAGGDIPRPPPGTGGGGGGGGPDDGPVPDPATRSRRRRKWWFFAALAVVAAISVGLIGEALRPASPGPRVLTDNQFVTLANQECARTLPGLRPPDGGPMGSAVTPAMVADQIDQAAVGLDALATRLAALPVSDLDKPRVGAWLDGWHQYDAIGHQYADFLRTHGATGPAPAVLKTGAVLARSIDNFARANGLHDCEFSFAYNPDPSQF